MPNRILRECILTSERVNALSPEAENFYRRLISVVDDYGRYFAKPQLLRSACYPLKIDEVSNNDVASWLQSCAKHMLVKCYQVDNTKYLELIDFRQQVRAKQSKFPCTADAKHMQEDDHLDVDVFGDVDEDDKSENKFSDDDIELAKYFFSLIKIINPKNKEPNFNTWADTIRLIREIDKRTHQEMKELFEWAHKHDFWQTNILSPSSLRRQWDTLTIQKNKKPNGKDKLPDINDREAVMAFCQEHNISTMGKSNYQLKAAMERVI